MTVVCWASANPIAGERGAWDMQIVEELTAGPEYEHCAPDEYVTKQWTGERMSLTLGSSWGDEGAVVVVAGQHNATDEYADAIVSFVASLPWALVIVTSDEEALFPVDLLPRDERHAVWNQYHDRGMDRVIPIGCPPGTAETLADIGERPRTTAVSFAGQATHERRTELVDVIKEMATDVRRYGDISWAATTGFREGLSQDRYLALLAETRIAPCPSGPHSLDSFRLYEALAAGALPVIEVRTPHGPEPGFWVRLFGTDCPIPTVATWKQLPKIVENHASGVAWQSRRDEVQEWYADWRESLMRDFEQTIARLRNS